MTQLQHEQQSESRESAPTPAHGTQLDAGLAADRQAREAVLRRVARWEGIVLKCHEQYADAAKWHERGLAGLLSHAGIPLIIGLGGLFFVGWNSLDPMGAKPIEWPTLNSTADLLGFACLLCWYGPFVLPVLGGAVALVAALMARTLIWAVERYATTQARRLRRYWGL